jgi:hypothetical protein
MVSILVGDLARRGRFEITGSGSTSQGLGGRHKVEFRKGCHEAVQSQYTMKSVREGKA